MNNILVMVLEIVATVAGVATLFWRLLKSNTDKNSVQVSKIQADYNNKIKAIQDEVESWEDRRRKDIRELHQRIDKADNFVKESLIGQLAKMEGEMKGMSNILMVIQEHFIKTGIGER